MKDIQTKIMQLDPASIDERIIIDIEDELLGTFIQLQEYPENTGGLFSPNKFNSIRRKLRVLKGKPDEPEARVIIGNILGLLGGVES